jgi:hypothetical protein
MKHEAIASPHLKVVSKKSDATWTSLNGLSAAAHEKIADIPASWYLARAREGLYESPNAQMSDLADT